MLNAWRKQTLASLCFHGHFQCNLVPDCAKQAASDNETLSQSISPVSILDLLFGADTLQMMISEPRSRKHLPHVYLYHITYPNRKRLSLRLSRSSNYNFPHPQAPGTRNFVLPKPYPAHFIWLLEDQVPMARTSASYTMMLLSILLLAALGPVASAVPFCGLVPPTLNNIARQQQSNMTASDDNFLASAWYPGWLGNTSPPSNISWDKYNAMTFAFAYVVGLLNRCHP